MDERYYAEYWTFEREHWWFRARRNILSEQIAGLLTGSAGRPRILNVGAALGASSEMLEPFGNVVSVEYERACCEFVAQHLGRTFINASITALPFPAESFDLVCAFDVIEHVDDDERAVREMMRVCKPGGTISVTVPAFMLLWSHHDVVNHHCRRYRLRELERLFRSSGRIVFATYFNTLLFAPIVGMRTLTKVIPSRWIRRGAGSDFSLLRNRALEWFLFQTMNIENAWLSRRGRLAVGVSALLHWRKD